MELEAFRGLLTPAGAAVLAEVQAAGVGDDTAALAVGSRLRRTHPPELVSAAITQARLRARAEVKFGAAAALMWFTPTGLEQSTRAEVAALRARRFAGSARIVDLCCGVGADLLALAAAGPTEEQRDVTGVESDPLTAAVAAANVAALLPAGRARVVLADATAVDLGAADAVFCDPARRTARGRVFDVGAYSPSWPFVRALLTGDLLTGDRRAAVKVAPGIPHELVPAGVEAEWVSVHGDVKEAALYSRALVSVGADGPARRRATLLPGGHTLSSAVADTAEEPPPVGPPGRWLYEPDGAVVRSHLVGAVVDALGGRLLDPTIAYVTTDAPAATPFATGYEITDVLPFSVKALRALLRSRGVGRLTVKKRGSPVTPEELRRQLGLRGDAEATVVLTRCAGVPTMLLVRPVAPTVNVPALDVPDLDVPGLDAAPSGLTRRGFVRGSAAAGAGAFGVPWVLPRAEPPPSDPEPTEPRPAEPRPAEPQPTEPTHPTGTPFTLGVASGEPESTGLVLWTRLALDPLALDGSGGMPPTLVAVDWQFADDEAFRHVVRTGTALAGPESAHSVHVELDGLEPGREYFYRFRSGGYLSPVGRTRTAPAATSRTPLHAAFVSCAHWEHGYFTAYRHLAESDPDVVFHLGDYMYESKAGEDVVADHDRRHVGPRTTTLATYRLRHAQYKTDLDLQAAHAAAPWVMSYDDHDVLDNWAGYTPANPKDQAAFPFIRAAAMQAYYENMPLRGTSAPIAGNMRMFRRLSWGRLANFHVLDTRQYRDAHACAPYYTPSCDERFDENRSMLGFPQEAWLRQGLGASSAVWDLIVQQVFFCPNEHMRAPKNTDDVVGLNMDTWDGYAAARDRLIATLLETRVRNPIVISGDVHSAWANEILREFGAAAYDPVAVEFVATSISSGRNGAPMSDWAARSLAAQPHLRFFDGRRGWTAVRATPDELRADYRVLPYVKRRGAPVSTTASFVVENGRPHLQRV